ncbi:MAG: hypothetical protein ACREMA_02115 [Longimicrobiales bacterium]
MLAACASVTTYFDSRKEERFAAGLAALHRGDYVTANEEMGWVVEHYGSEDVGRQALLAVAAIEMDPRNPQRRLTLGSELAGAYLRQPQAEWLQPVAQTLYLLSIEMGAAEERVAQVEAEKQQVERRIEEVERSLPQLPESVMPFPARVRAMKEAHDRLARKVEALETQLAERDKKLADTEKELERIKKTLKG